jgi:hypothetical protein
MLGVAKREQTNMRNADMKAFLDRFRQSEGPAIKPAEAQSTNPARIGDRPTTVPASKTSIAISP